MTKERVKQYFKVVDDITLLKSEIKENGATDKISNILEEKEKEEQEIRKFIEEIDYLKARRVFKLRYFKRFTWLQIAMAIGKSDESYPRKHIHDKYFEEFASQTGKAAL